MEATPRGGCRLLQTTESIAARQAALETSMAKQFARIERVLHGMVQDHLTLRAVQSAAMTLTQVDGKALCG